MSHRPALLPALLLLALLAVAPGRAAQPGAPSQAFLPLVVQPGAGGLSADEQFVLAAVNAERARAGCGPLGLAPALQSSARAHSDDMARRDYFNHTDPDGGDAADRAAAAGYASAYVGENVAAGQATGQIVLYDVRFGWMSSTTHRQNILNCRFTETGIALTDQPDDRPNVLLPNGATGGPFRYYWTQVFGNPKP